MARSRPFSRISSRSAESLSTLRIDSANSSTLCGSTIIPAFPTTSGSEEIFEVMTGVPQAMASSGGRPSIELLNPPGDMCFFKEEDFPMVDVSQA